MGNILKNVPHLIKNKYSITVFVFIAWLSFFDDQDLFTLYKNMKQLDELKAQKEQYEVEIAETKRQLKELTTNKTSLEKFAREQYLMKKENEVIYYIVEED